MKKSYLSFATIVISRKFNPLWQTRLKKRLKEVLLKEVLVRMCNKTMQKMGKSGFSNGYATIGYETGTFIILALE